MSNDVEVRWDRLSALALRDAVKFSEPGLDVRALSGLGDEAGSAAIADNRASKSMP